MSTNAKLILDLLHAVEERDLDRLAELYHPDVEFVWPPSLPGYGGTHRGADDVGAMQIAYATAWLPVQASEETRRLDPQILADDGDEVLVAYHQRGAHEDGRRCDVEVIGRYRIRDDRVVRLQMFYFDPDAVKEFLLGATPGR